MFNTIGITFNFHQFFEGFRTDCSKLVKQFANTHFVNLSVDVVNIMNIVSAIHKFPCGLGGVYMNPE